MELLIILAVISAPFIWLYNLYASLIKKRNKVEEAFSCIDVQLKKRYDLIPNILTIAAKFMEHEKNLLEEITNLRVKALNLPAKFENINEKIQLDEEIKKAMSNLMVSVENYPQLKSDQTMVTAMTTYNEVEEHIAAARRFYNSAASELKSAIEIYPSSVFAEKLNIKPVEFFKIDTTERKPINASDYFKNH